MSRRRRWQEEPPNQERWLISYADFITLLFAFFVVMYSVSSVNEGKYKVLSDSLTGVFNAPQRAITPVQADGTPPGSNALPAGTELVSLPVARPGQSPVTDRHNGAEAMRAMADALAAEFGELIQQGVATLEISDDWLELGLRGSLLFASGDAEPHYDAFEVVKRIARVLRGREHAIRVEGFTDNQPIHTGRYPSNWELSSARAAAVVRMLAMDGVAPDRMAAIGYGEFQPVAGNDTVEGRSRNRRVVVLISREAGIRGAVR
ncbi:flagellar motor protein MotD [Marinobacter sp. X15-166B]|uniref:flagellar motor protein MotD n=1 Tax=Marinobacter sp. X15-166B TaxID=1897620 RepID=UPI00085C64CB|nr:flagellar motor protein MotD [Marinobacter sp. X15-166B]OEY67091.1 flagellar motor protein MotD [Marinobacter sp. X15-166B]